MFIPHPNHTRMTLSYSKHHLTI